MMIPSGIATYSQAGAAYGLSTLWTALITFPLMAAIQEMCARIGMITAQGLAGTLKTNYSKPILYLMLLFSFPAIVMNIGADIAGMGAVGNLLIPSIHAISFRHRFHYPAFSINCIFTVSKDRFCSEIPLYRSFSVFYCSVFIQTRFTGNLKSTFYSDYKIQQRLYQHSCCHPGYNHFTLSLLWQATMEVEDIKQKKKHLVVNKRILHEMKRDVGFWNVLFKCYYVLYYSHHGLGFIYRAIFIRSTPLNKRLRH